MLLTLQPVGSAILGVLLLDEAPAGLQVAGVGLILFGVVSLALRRRRRVPTLA